MCFQGFLFMEYMDKTSWLAHVCLCVFMCVYVCLGVCMRPLLCCMC